MRCRVMVLILPLFLLLSVSPFTAPSAATLSLRHVTTYSTGEPISLWDQGEIYYTVYTAPSPGGPWTLQTVMMVGIVLDPIVWIEVPSPKPNKTLYYSVVAELHGAASAMSTPYAFTAGRPGKRK